MKLLEIVRGRETSKEVIATSVKLGEAARQGRRSSSATASGSSPTACSPTTCARRTCCSRKARACAQIDRVLTDFGMPVGPFGMQDIAGIDVGARIRQYLASIGKTRAEGPQSEVPDRLFEMGRYGQKTGAGWYRYEAGQPQPHSGSADRTSSREEAAAKRGITRRPIADDEILARITTALANEGARVLEDGFATARRRHRRHLLLRLRLPAPSRRPDVLRRHGRPADRARARATSTARASATTGSRRRCSSGWSPRAAGSTMSSARVWKSQVMSDDRNPRRLRSCATASARRSPSATGSRSRRSGSTQFAEATDDRQWIHVDPARAASESPFKTTIAHGFLTLSLVSALLRNAIRFSGAADGASTTASTASASSPPSRRARASAARFVPASSPGRRGRHQVMWNDHDRARRQRQAVLRRRMDRSVLTSKLRIAGL